MFYLCATVSNLLAMEAPKGGSGNYIRDHYTRDQISDALHMVFMGFAVVRMQSIVFSARSRSISSSRHPE